MTFHFQIIDCLFLCINAALVVLSHVCSLQRFVWYSSITAAHASDSDLLDNVDCVTNKLKLILHPIIWPCVKKLCNKQETVFSRAGWRMLCRVVVLFVLLKQGAQKHSATSRTTASGAVCVCPHINITCVPSLKKNTSRCALLMFEPFQM